MCRDPASDRSIETDDGVRVRRVCFAGDGTSRASVEIITGRHGWNLSAATQSQLRAVAAQANLSAERHMRREALLDTDAMRMTVLSGSHAVVVIHSRDGDLMRAIARSIKYNLIERMSGSRPAR